MVLPGLRPAPFDNRFTNLENLRSQVAGKLVWLAIGSSLFAIWLSLLLPFSAAFLLLLLLLGMTLCVRALLDRHPTLARHFLVWGLLAEALAGMWIVPNPYLPFLAISLIFVSAILVFRSEVAIALLVAALAWWLNQRGLRTYPMPELAVALALATPLAWLSVHTIYTALQWTWNMQQQTNRFLDEARDHRGELVQAVKSYELANGMLRRTERELTEARRQAEEAKRLKEQFAANISHELRTPLSLILGFSEMMYLSPGVYGELDWPTMLRRDVYQIYRSSRHLLGMIDDILDLSRAEITGFALTKDATPLGPLLTGTAEVAQDLFRSSAVSLDVEIDAQLPVLEIDRTRIRQVLLNLLNNALRFTEEGVVCLRAIRRDQDILVSIRDTGPGIPADKIALIFDEFYQVDLSLRRGHQGAGLGLAISKRFVEAHGGRIWVESQEGVGATFFFTLPLPDEYVPLSRVHGGTTLQPQWIADRPRILAVESDRSVISLLRRHMEKYDVIQVERRADLDHAITVHRPHAVIWNAPPDEARAMDNPTPNSVPMIRCSLPSQAWLAADLMVVDCLTKPVTSQLLLRVVEQIQAVDEVLIIDDDRGFVQLIKRILQSSGRDLSVSWAYSGEEGLVAMRTRRPDLVLLDLVMPGGDGFETLSAMRGDSELEKIPVILLTATTFAQDALPQRHNQIVIQQAGGLQMAETLRCLHSLVDLLQPRYDQHAAADSAVIDIHLTDNGAPDRVIAGQSVSR